MARSILTWFHLNNSHFWVLCELFANEMESKQVLIIEFLFASFQMFMSFIAFLIKSLLKFFPFLFFYFFFNYKFYYKQDSSVHRVLDKNYESNSFSCHERKVFSSMQIKQKKRVKILATQYGQSRAQTLGRKTVLLNCRSSISVI